MNELVGFDKLENIEELDDSSSILHKCDSNDLEHHASLFKGIELESIQLSPGAFEGRVVSAVVDQITIHVSQSMQAIEQCMKVDKDKYLFCICLCETCKDTVFGVQGAGSWVYVLPPGGEAIAPTPTQCPLLLMTVQCEALLNSENLVPDVGNWFRTLKRDGEFVRSQRLANRIQDDALMTLQSAKGILSANGPRTAQIIHQAMISSIAAGFSLEWLERGTFAVIHRTPALDRFLKARHLLTERDLYQGGEGNEALSKLGSKRSVEQAFSAHVKMGPRSYARILRLHNARRKLREERFFNESIGNIAAQEGFWDWSRFTAYYSKHFGELPSATRRKAMRRN
ncbi:MAG: helix-turn-helix domain-containing protein [Pseudomonadota bacterium]